MNEDLISRSALLEELSKGTIITDDLYGMGIMAGNENAMKKINEAPAVDAETVCKQIGLVKEAFEMAKTDLVAVVRCKDCKHYCPYEGEEHKGDCDELVGLESCVYEDDFCSYGKRRADT